jgi:tetratricopeptide (TPR) repeat protein
VARAQRTKAEKRLTELRGVAKSLLTETNAQLAQLPKGIEIRKSIVEKSVAVLDNLAGDESNDFNFLNELADGYAELGRMRHWQFHQSRQALSDLNKAWQLRMRAIALEPKNVHSYDQLSLTLMNLGEVYGSLADREGSLRVWQAQLQNDLSLIELEPNNPQVYYTAAAYGEDLAEGLKEFNRMEESAAALDQSFQWAEKAIALQQAASFSIDGQVLLVTFSMQKASLLRKMGRDDEALTVYQSASDLAQQTYYADKTKRFAFNHASRIHRYMGDIYAERGDWPKYLECSEFSLNWIKENIENRALWSQGIQPTTTYYLMRVGIGLNKLGKKQAGTADVDEAIKQYNQSLGTHDINGGDIIWANELLEPASDFYVETSQISKAVAIWDNYIALINPFVTRNPQDTSSLGYLSSAYERKGDSLAIYQKGLDTFAQTNIVSLRAALTSYETASEHRQRILQLDPTNQSHIEVEKTLAQKISRLKERLK